MFDKGGIGALICSEPDSQEQIMKEGFDFVQVAPQLSPGRG
jgi:hypothetical protein